MLFQWRGGSGSHQLIKADGPHPFSTPHSKMSCWSLEISCGGSVYPLEHGKGNTSFIFSFCFSFFGELLIAINVISTSLMEETGQCNCHLSAPFVVFFLMSNYTETQLLRASVYILNFRPRWSWKWKHIMLWIDRPNSVECPPIHYYTILIYMITFDPMVPWNCCFHYRICAKFLPVLLKIIEFFSCRSLSRSVIMNSFGPMLRSLRNDFLSSFVHSWEASMTFPA